MNEEASEHQEGHGRPFLGVMFVTCGVYGRFYKNPEGTAYVGTCPRCGKYYTIRIGSEGTSNRFFNAFCRRG
jgi:hypothetical protein